MSLEVIEDWPPNIDAIDEVLHVRHRPGIIYCYGRRIFNPWKITVDQYLMAHEEVHADRQTDPEGWWRRYLVDVEFRFQEELPAHIAQAKAFAAANGERWRRRAYVSQVAKTLSGPIYGHLISFEKARQILREA